MSGNPCSLNWCTRSYWAVPTFSWLMNWEHVSGKVFLSSFELIAAAQLIILRMLGWIFLILSFFDSSQLSSQRILLWWRLLDLTASLFWSEIAAVSRQRIDEFSTGFLSSSALISWYSAELCCNAPCFLAMQAWCHAFLKYMISLSSGMTEYLVSVIVPRRMP